MNETYRRNFLVAGAIANEVRAFGKALVKKGASYNEVVTQIHKKIHALGAHPAFPPQMALNDVAAHYLPSPDEDIIFSDQLVKLDIGVCYKGAIGDCAVTIDLSGRYHALIDAVEAALAAAESSIKVGQPIREIGGIIDKTISARGFSSVKNLSGHGLDFNKIHTAPTIPNYDDRSKGVIKPGMTFAIEPFATDGVGYIYESGTPEIFSFAAKRPVTSEPARSLLTKINTFEGLPFAVRDLVAVDYPLNKVRAGIAELVKAGVIVDYAPLVEERHGMVAQAENSILVDDAGQVTITTRQGIV